MTPDREILLMLFQVPSNRLLWIAPGGGLAPGESPEEAATREVLEETGIRVQVSRPVWTRTHRYPCDGAIVHQTETFFLADVARFDPTSVNLEALERRSFREFRWWNIAAIHASTEQFAPRGLAKHLSRLLETGPPSRPIDVGI